MVMVPRFDEDPFSALLLPPQNETSEQRTIRLQKEAEARRVSDEIDESIKREKAAMKRRGDLRMLLLGQSESGKSTTLKNMQMMHAPQMWQEERAKWRAVVQLNLIRAVNAILEGLSPQSEPPYISSPSIQFTLSLDPNDDDNNTEITPMTPPEFAPLETSNTHTILKLRLKPLESVERDLKALLGAASEEITESNLQGGARFATPFDTSSYDHHGDIRPRKSSGKHREFCVRSHDAWKHSLSFSDRISASSRSGASNNATGVLASCQADIRALWGDQLVQTMIARRQIRLGDSAEFYLDNVHRIATTDYEPTDDDVIRARLRTTGVQEYRLPLRHENYKEWRLYDVGGSRTVRAAWVPFFEDIHAILFLAPISCFDEYLAEDRKVNRLKDSVILWKSIVASELLLKARIILFLNKCDLLRKKLASGVLINRYIPRYHDRDNDWKTFGKYMKDKFRDYLKQYSPQRDREFYGYLTSVIDTRATSTTLIAVQDGIIRKALRDCILL